MARQFTVTYKVKNLFFDRAQVIREVGKLNAKALSKAGAFVRRRARSIQRRRKAASAPGTPPSVHSKDKIATLRNILFAYDSGNKSVVIGPVLLNRARVNVPALHEFGGTSRRRVKKKWVATRYPARPFMGPALKAETPNFPSLWVTNSGGGTAV